MPVGFSPKLPLHISDSDGYALTKTTEEMVKQNFKNLVLTSPGERVMDPEFGIGLRRYLFEQNNTLVLREIRGRIQSQVSIYMPYVNILRVKFLSGVTGETTGFKEIFDSTDMSFDFYQKENLLYVSIEYEIGPLSLKNILNVLMT